MGSLNICSVCGKPATKICSACHLVSYCSVQHQKDDWKAHKKSCRVYEIKSNERFGRYTIATRDIEAGTIIMSEPAIMIGPKQNTLPVCLGCNKRVPGENGKKYYCSKCLIFPVCGEECEKIPLHAENECKVFAGNKAKFKPISNFEEPHPAYECIMTLRCLFLKERDPKKWKKLTNMQHHNEFRKQSIPQLWHRNEVNTVRFLREIFQLTQFSEMDIHDVLGYYDVNSFEVKFEDIETSGLFDNTYIMAHDCISNTIHKFTEDFKMVVRCTVPIKKGEYITTTYAHTLEGTLERRLDIRQSKFFECCCERCSDPTEFGTYFSAVRCLHCTKPNGYLRPKEPTCSDSQWSCSECGYLEDVKDVQALTQKLKDEIKALDLADKSSPVRYEELLKKYSGRLLHPNHFLIINMESSLLSFYGRMKGWMISELDLDVLLRKEALCRHVLSVLDIMEAGLSRIRGITLYELHAAIYFSQVKKYHNKGITALELKKSLQEVLGLLYEADSILSFEPPNSIEGTIAKSIPTSIVKIRESLSNL